MSCGQLRQRAAKLLQRAVQLVQRAVLLELQQYYHLHGLVDQEPVLLQAINVV